MVGVKGEASERIQERREKLREFWWGNQALDLEKGITAVAVELARETPERGFKAKGAEGSGGVSGVDFSICFLEQRAMGVEQFKIGLCGGGAVPFSKDSGVDFGQFQGITTFPNGYSMESIPKGADEGDEEARDSSVSNISKPYTTISCRKIG